MRQINFACSPISPSPHTLAGLENAGLVMLARNPKDARSKCVWLTDKRRWFSDEAILALGPHYAAPFEQIGITGNHAELPALTSVRLVLDRMREPNWSYFLTEILLRESEGDTPSSKATASAGAIPQEWIGPSPQASAASRTASE